MKVKFLCGILLLMLIGCTTEPIQTEITLDITPALPQDPNGYYHLPLNRTTWQTIQRITGTFDRNGYEPEYLKLHWTSDHYWIIDDNIGYIVDVWNCYECECEEPWEAPIYIGLDTLYLTQFNGREVPTVNPANYSSGEINTVFAPVLSMIGDTVTITVEVAGGQNAYGSDFVKIVLE